MPRPYLRELVRTYPLPCGKRATVEMFDEDGQHCGCFCREHGRKALADHEKAQLELSK